MELSAIINLHCTEKETELGEQEADCRSFLIKELTHRIQIRWP